jgi:cyclopropane-fatty-acyl-phospholipid synthase
LPGTINGFIGGHMRAEGLGRGKTLLSAGARFERSPGLVARAFAPGFHKVLDRIDAGLATG